LTIETSNSGIKTKGKYQVSRQTFKGYQD